MPKLPNRENWKGVLYADFWDRAAQEVNPDEDRAGHSRALRALIVEEFGTLPSSMMFPDFSLNYPDKAAEGKNTLGGATEGDKDLYGAQKAAGGRLSTFEGRLAHTCIKLWSNPGDLILDPFAGRATRLQAALDNGRRYVGFDPSREAFEACCEVLEERDAYDEAQVFCGSSLFLDEELEPESVDYVLTCPPYWNSEFYGDNGTGLEGTPDYRAFVEELAACLLLAAQALKKDRYLTYVLRGFFLGGTFLDTPAHLQRYLSGSGLMIHDQIAKKFSNSRERFHTDVLLWRRTAQVHEQVVTWVKGKPSSSKSLYRDSTREKNVARQAEESLLRQRREKVLRQTLGVDPALCTPLLPKGVNV